MLRVEQNATTVKQIPAFPQGEPLRSDVPYSPRQLTILRSADRTIMTKVNSWTGRAHTPVEQKGYQNAKWFTWELRPFRDIFDIAVILGELRSDIYRCVIRAHPADMATRDQRIRKKKNPLENGDPPTFIEVKRGWIMVDIDKLRLPAGYDMRENTDDCVQYGLELLGQYAPETLNVTCYVQLSSSAGLDTELHGPGADRKMSAHMWFVLNTPAGEAELKRWAAHVNARAMSELGCRLLDPAPFRTVQPNYVADPVFKDMGDPLPWRGGLFEGDRHTLELDIPDEAAVVAMSSPGLHAESKLPSGMGSRYYLNQIGDDKDGFNEPIWMATVAAIEEQGDGFSRANFIADVRTAVRAANPGARSKDDIDRYAGDTYLNGNIVWARGHRRSKEAQLAVKRAAREAQRAAVDNADPAPTLKEGRRELARALEHHFATAEDYVAMRRLSDSKCDQAELAIHDKLRREGFVPGTDHEGEFRARMKTERRRIRREAAEEFDFDRFSERAPAAVIDSSAGLGKTQCATEQLAGWHSGRVEFFAPTHELLEQTHAKLKALGTKVPVHLVRGRKAPDPLGRLVGKAGRWKSSETHMCARYDEAKAMSDVGASVRLAICRTCPLATRCGYLAQFDGIVKGHGIVLLAQSYMTRKRPEELAGEVDLVIIDENPTGPLYVEHIIDIRLFTDRSRIAELSKDRSEIGVCIAASRRLANAMVVAGHVKGTIQRFADDIAQKVIGDVLSDLWAVIEGRAEMGSLDAGALNEAYWMLADGRKELVHPANLSQAAFARVMEGLRDGHLVMLLIEHTLQCMARGMFDIRETLARDGRSVTMTVFTPPAIPRATPVIILDATAGLGHLRYAFDREFERTRIVVPENVRITQVIDISGSKMSLTGRNTKQRLEDASEHAKAAQGRRIEQMADIAADFIGGGPGAVLGHMGIVDAMREHLPDTIDTGHYGALRGLNRLKGVRKLVIIGKQMIDRGQIERKRAVLFARRGNAYYGGVTPGTIAEFGAVRGMDELPQHGYLENKFGDPWHPDPVAEEMRRETCEAEILQAVARARSFEQDEPVDVLLITNVYLPELPAPEREVKWLELIRHGRPGGAVQVFEDRIAGLQKGRDAIVVPRGSADMARLAPDIFRTPNAANMARKKQDEGALEIRTPPGESWRQVRGTYRVAGQRGSASPMGAAVKKGVNDMIGAVWDGLEFLLGRKVRGVKLDDQ